MKGKLYLVMLALLAMAVQARPVKAQTLGMVANNNHTVTIINADADVALGTVILPGFGVFTGDCSITADQTRGFVTDFTFSVHVIDLTTTPPSLAPGPNPIPISNIGEDTSISPDGQFLVVCDGSNSSQPVSVVDIATQTECSTFSLGSQDCNSAEFCSDGSVLVTSFNTNTVRRLTIDGAGNLTDTGEVLPSFGGNMNAYCDPGATSGFVVRFFSGDIQSFTIPGLGPVDTRGLGGNGISGLINPTGDRAFVRSNFPGFVNVFGYNSTTAALSASPLLIIPVSNTIANFFGMEQMALHPNGTKLYVSQPGELAVYDPDTGVLLTSIPVPGSPTGVCFANASDLDPDNDGIDNPFDNCPNTFNPGQADNDNDGTGNACDPCINDFGPPFNSGCPLLEVPPGTQVSSDPSACDIIVDGQFGSNACVEWADITPVVTLGGDSIIYQALDPDGGDLYLMYDFIGSQTPLGVGEESGVVRFFVGDDVFDVFFIQGGPPGTLGAGDEVRVLRNRRPFDDSLGSIVGAVDFNNSSPNFAPPHNLFELEVVLLQTEETPGGLPPGGGGLYSPDPAFWGASLPGSPLVQVSANVIDIQAGGVVVAIVSNMIDIKPGSDPNAINTKSMGVVPVAILGSETFDAADVDVLTLTFGPAGASPAHIAPHLEDVNDDGFADLVSHYRQKETGLSQGDLQACINGETNGGEPIFGCDSVVIVQ